MQCFSIEKTNIYIQGSFMQKKEKKLEILQVSHMTSEFLNPLNVHRSVL